MYERHFLYMQYGIARRKAILEYAKVSPWGIHVNRKHCPQLKQDSDLMYLIKKGLLVRSRESRGNNMCRVTVLRYCGR